MSRSSTHSTSMTEQKKGKITDQRNELVKLNQVLAVDRYKAINQVKDGYKTCIMRDCHAEVYNVFGIKKDDASLFLVDVLKIGSATKNNSVFTVNFTQKGRKR